MQGKNLPITRILLLSLIIGVLYEQVLTLNGLLLILLGSALLLVLLYLNLKSTSLLFGIVVSIVQLTLFGVASYFAFFALILAIAWFAQTKPVYSINDD